MEKRNIAALAMEKWRVQWKRVSVAIAGAIFRARFIGLTWKEPIFQLDAENADWLEEKDLEKNSNKNDNFF